MPNQIKIIPINWGIACRIKDEIYIHRSIPKNSKLYASLIKHELEHSDDYSLGDLLMDINGRHLKGTKKAYYKFLFSHFSAWAMFLPIWRFKKSWIIDPTMIGLWCFVLVLILGGIYLL